MLNKDTEMNVLLNLNVSFACNALIIMVSMSFFELSGLMSYLLIQVEC